MPFQDEWGHDPSVQSMRRIFSHMEKAQNELLRHVKISPLDQRLRRGREHARTLFERLWPLATRKGIVASEEDAALLYIHCLANLLSRSGIAVPSDSLPQHEKISKLLKENLR
jgi:hypothetical protein